MMKKDFGIKIEMMNGEVITFAKGQVSDYGVMPAGAFFVQGARSRKDTHRNHSNESPIDKTVLSEHRYWIPLINIKRVDMDMDIHLTSNEDVRKYDKFMAHGIDMISTKISHTEVNSDEVAKIIDQEIKLENEAKDGGVK